MPTSGMPADPGPPDVLPFFGALASGIVDVLPDEPVAPLAPELPVPSRGAKPGAPDVAVPTEPEPEVEGRSAPLVTSSALLPDDPPALLLPVSLLPAPLLDEPLPEAPLLDEPAPDAPLLDAPLPSVTTPAPGRLVSLVVVPLEEDPPLAPAEVALGDSEAPDEPPAATALPPNAAKSTADAAAARNLFVIGPDMIVSLLMVGMSVSFAGR